MNTAQSHLQGAGPAANRATAAGVPGGVISFPNLPVIYMNMPKSACTSIKNHLYFLHKGHYYTGNPLEIHKEPEFKSRGVDAEQQKEIRRRLATRTMSFTFVRHPGKRAYSCFGEKICVEGPFAFGKVRQYMIKRYGLDFQGWGTPEYDLNRHRENYIRYLHFVRDNIAEKTFVRRDPHWGPQTQVIENFQRTMVIDFIGRVENFTEDLKFALRSVPAASGIDWSQKFNEGPPPPFTYEAIATTDVRDLMFQVFKRDYERLAYAR
jgi:hypothetical protein